jgi:hypothetical protein
LPDKGGGNPKFTMNMQFLQNPRNSVSEHVATAIAIKALKKLGIKNDCRRPISRKPWYDLKPISLSPPRSALMLNKQHYYDYDSMKKSSHLLRQETVPVQSEQ